MRFSAASGIAIGPILFVIALLAILATAISAATSSFSGGTDQEKARAMAEAVLSSCQQYKTALARMLANGCAIDQIDWRPDVPFPSGATYTSGDFTGGNGTNKDGSGKCAMHHLLGGGMQWRQLPREALADTLTGAYASGGLTGTYLPNQDAFAGYPILYGHQQCIRNRGTCSTSDDYSNNAVIMLSYHYLRADVCRQINKILKFSWANSNIYVGMAYAVGHSFFTHNVSSAGSGFYVSARYTLATVNISDGEACGYSYYSNSQNSDYQYMCALMVR